MAIHLVQRSEGFSACRDNAAAEDVVVLLGEGVMALLSGAQNCYASRIDVQERGMENRVASSVRLISDAELVALCAENTPVVSWTDP